MKLKNYQIRTLEVLQKYMETCTELQDADTAFYKVTKDIYDAGIPYQNVAELPGLPYVCLRIPTGGGKTLVACHALGVIAPSYMQSDQIVVLWLVPSKTILQQTLAALKNPNHAYHRALRTSIGSFVVYSVGEALCISRPVLLGETIIIVSTIQAFRIEDTEGRKVYEAAGQLKPLFENVDYEVLKCVERDTRGEVIPSLSNVFRMRNPVVIVDEAHNARTTLSFATLARLSPSCIIEFTATPDTETNPSNVLYSVSAAELKAENMIKLPVILETRPDWKEVLYDAISTRVNLEEIARQEALDTGEYIRPILLIQAEANWTGQERITWDVIRKVLVEDYKIPSKHIAVETGSHRDLEGVDILDKACDTRYIITVQALKEGWDCPFAYGLCSVAEMHSSTAVEQIIGRVLRLPLAEPKVHKELNMAYCFSSSNNFGSVASALADAMVQNGFERQEAKDLIKRRGWLKQPNLDFSCAVPLLKPIQVVMRENPDFSKLSGEMINKISYDHNSHILSLKELLNDKQKEELKQAVTQPEDWLMVEQQLTDVLQHSQGEEPAKSPSENGNSFTVPILAVKQGELFEPFEDTHFLEIPWKLSKCDTSLDQHFFPDKRNTGQIGEVTVSEKGKIETHFITTLQKQMSLFMSDHGWELPELVLWLDRTIPHADIDSEDTQIFIANTLIYLCNDRAFSLERLVKERYRLRNAMAHKIEVHRLKQRKLGWEQLLFSESIVPVVVSDRMVFQYNMDPYSYPCRTRYEGQYKFIKHYYPAVGELKGEGEEFECAQFIDLLPEVKYWVRNLERQPNHSFWLQTSSDKFYPDFVCELNDGRYLVVEYKGTRDYTNEDSKEKRLLGELWEAKSNNKCLFVMPTGRNYEEIRLKIYK